MLRISKEESASKLAKNLERESFYDALETGINFIEKATLEKDKQIQPEHPPSGTSQNQCDLQWTRAFKLRRVHDQLVANPLYKEML